MLLSFWQAKKWKTVISIRPHVDMRHVHSISIPWKTAHSMRHTFVPTGWYCTRPLTVVTLVRDDFPRGSDTINRKTSGLMIMKFVDVELLPTSTYLQIFCTDSRANHICARQEPAPNAGKSRPWSSWPPPGWIQAARNGTPLWTRPPQFCLSDLTHPRSPRSN